MSGVVVWFTGLPSSGKTTLARAVAARVPGAVLLDGDEVRAAMRPAPGYDEASRAAFYETLARWAALLAQQGHVVLVAATAHRRAFRRLAREVAPRFVEVFVDTPPEECRRRDAKGLYASGQAQVPGAGVVYEVPEAAEVVVHPGDDGAEARIAALCGR
ncbi:MAG: adenylyl-sulfate kinase [Myxococcota bacterium]